VLALAVVLAFADGFWIISLRAQVGALERTESPPPGCARPPSPCRSSSSPCSAQSPWPCTWWLEVDLWGPDGRTDYTLEATAVETPDGSRLNVRDIHVMSHRPHLENATLRLIGDEQSVVAIGEFARLGYVLRGEGIDPALTLN
jgi:hypothetical protein